MYVISAAELTLEMICSSSGSGSGSTKTAPPGLFLGISSLFFSLVSSMHSSHCCCAGPKFTSFPLFDKCSVHMSHHHRHMPGAALRCTASTQTHARGERASQPARNHQPYGMASAGAVRQQLNLHRPGGKKDEQIFKRSTAATKESGD
jgi:hypothetical protein